MFNSATFNSATFGSLAVIVAISLLGAITILSNDEDSMTIFSSDDELTVL